MITVIFTVYGNITEAFDTMLKQCKKCTLCSGICTASFELPESLLVRELVYVFQGIDGKYIRYEKYKEGFKLDSEVHISYTDNTILIIGYALA